MASLFFFLKDTHSNKIKYYWCLEMYYTGQASFKSNVRTHRRMYNLSDCGFTLLEMLVVLVIIGLLAGLVGPRLFSKVDQSKISTAQTQIKLLRGAVENLRLDIGRYPHADEGLALLQKAPQDPAIAQRWRGPYLDDAVPQDPWGQAYQYAVPGADGQPFALYSLGSDGKRGGEGDAKDIGVLPAQSP